MVEFLDASGFVEHGVEVAVEAVGPQRLDDNLDVGLAVVTEEGGAETAGAEDAQRLVARQRERLELFGVEGGGAAEGGQGLVPVAAFEGGAVDVVMGLGLAAGVGDEAGDFLEVVLAGFEIADDDFELGEAVGAGAGSRRLLRSGGRSRKRLTRSCTTSRSPSRRRARPSRGRTAQGWRSWRCLRPATAS